MADNTTLPGTGDVIATDDVGGVKYQVVKLDLGGNGASSPVSTTVPVTQASVAVPYTPNYGIPATSVASGLPIDPDGQVSVRGSIMTDEGTFRCNFANTSLAVSLGSVTISGAVVTGSGFAGADDVHKGDYFKLDADGESAWVQIESIDSDTQLTLISSYVGGSSGAASRAIVRPVTGSGGAISVASGQLTMTTGTTNDAITRIVRNVDIAPLVYRARVSFSQRIANQTFRLGLSESFTTSDRWFARFKIDGTTNTTVICESGRNPTTTPSAAETETTTVTLPNGATTATMRDYRVEQLTEKCNFFIDDILVATHTRAIPSQHDEMEASITCINGTGAASTTTVIADYITGKNHNKLEIGVMSDSEKIVASAPPMAEYNYSVAGVITINTDLIVIDCSQLRSLNIHCTSMGTTGVVTPQWSNSADFTGAVTATLVSEAGATSTTFNAAVLRNTNVKARYFRLRLTTATTAGTTTIKVTGSQTDTSPIVTTQPVSGTVTANIGTGALAAGTNAIGDVGIQYRANATGAATIHHFVAAATTNTANIKASAGRVVGWNLANTTAAWRYLKLHNTAGTPTAGAAVVMTIGIPPGGSNSMPVGGGGIGFATGIGRSCVTGAADADATATAANDVVGDIFFA